MTEQRKESLSKDIDGDEPRKDTELVKAKAITHESTATPPSMQDILEAMKDNVLQEEEEDGSEKPDTQDEISDKIIETLDPTDNSSAATDHQAKETYSSFKDCECPSKSDSFPQHRLSIGKTIWLAFKSKTKDHFQISISLSLLLVAIIILVVAMVFLFRNPGETVHQPETFIPGKLVVSENGLLLSQGLQSKIIATSDMFVAYQDGSISNTTCHKNMDIGATFPDTRDGNDGGWLYVSNSKAEEDGGVGVLTMNAQGNVVDYRMVHTGASCSGGGKTYWNTWITCLEMDDGRCYQIDPTGQREAQVVSLGGQAEGGNLDSFTYWLKKDGVMEYFTSENSFYGAVRRFLPEDSSSSKRDALIGGGATDYLLVNITDQTFQWIKDADAARDNAQMYFPDATSLSVYEGRLFFLSQSLSTLFTLDLTEHTYLESSTKIGKFDGEPNQIALPPGTSTEKQLIYFTETNVTMCGIFARNGEGMYTLVNTPRRDDAETTGIAFSPNGKHLYFVLHKAGFMYDITRKDGQSFYSQSLDILYED